ncbi:glucoamylase family protein [Acidipila sp. EB88]|uniref:glucoamylase family protein n=1 Tax=Acidipila sp. EB88 TaxID=2305226 RepID=UPI000F5F57FE|nr:glucoamylase family protein [Acidipila sp. EB88]RRA48348.1 hypothetical protein D1Y84_08660 [Acidipila sp. EB88]
MKRRDVLRALGALPALAATPAFLLQTGCNHNPHEQARRLPTQPRMPASPVKNQPTNFDSHAHTLLDEVTERCAHYFIERAHKDTGIVFDRAPANGSGAGLQYTTGSIAATGFGLSVLCVAAQHGYLAPAACEQRIAQTLAFIAHQVQHEHGFLPHYLHAATGVAAANSEFSSIDTALLIAGALHARQFLNSARVDALVATIYERVDWSWMLNGYPQQRTRAHGAPATLSMGWLPGSGFLEARWDSYSECMLMYLLAIGSPSHPIPAGVWQGIQRNTFDYGGIRFISSFGALFIHQYLHIWTDLRGLGDGHSNYFENSVAAVRAHKTWCMLQHGRYPWVDERVWGFSASDTAQHAYAAWAAPPVVGDWDGTLAPHAAGGSLALLPEESIVVLKAMREHHPPCFQRYGFVNAFLPGGEGRADWFDSDVIASDLALTMLMAENQRGGTVRSLSMRNPELLHAIHAVGFHRLET